MKLETFSTDSADWLETSSGGLSRTSFATRSIVPEAGGQLLLLAQTTSAGIRDHIVLNLETDNEDLLMRTFCAALIMGLPHSALGEAATTLRDIGAYYLTQDKIPAIAPLLAQPIVGTRLREVNRPDMTIVAD